MEDTRTQTASPAEESRRSHHSSSTLPNERDDQDIEKQRLHGGMAEGTKDKEPDPNIVDWDGPDDPVCLLPDAIYTPKLKA